jgi:hypothetical protein
VGVRDLVEKLERPENVQLRHRKVHEHAIVDRRDRKRRRWDMSDFELLISDDMSVLLLLAARTPERNKERIVSFMSSCVER